MHSLIKTLFRERESFFNRFRRSFLLPEIWFNLNFNNFTVLLFLNNVEAKSSRICPHLYSLSLGPEGKETLKHRCPRAEKFTILSNNHGRTQKCSFCVCLKSKMLCFCRFSPSSSRIRSKKCFTDHHKPNTIHGFGDLVVFCKMHDCYCNIRKIL